MSQKVTKLRFAAEKIKLLGVWGGRLYLGVLGVEFAIKLPSLDSEEGVDVELDVAAGNNSLSISDLHFNFLKRTNQTEDYAFSDGVLPVYVRFEPDLLNALNSAGGGDSDAGTKYANQSIRIEKPNVHIEGKVAVYSPGGGITFQDKEIVMKFPVDIRDSTLTLGYGKGLIAFLAQEG